MEWLLSPSPRNPRYCWSSRAPAESERLSFDSADKWTAHQSLGLAIVPCRTRSAVTRDGRFRIPAVWCYDVTPHPILNPTQPIPALVCFPGAPSVLIYFPLGSHLHSFPTHQFSAPFCRDFGSRVCSSAITRRASPVPVRLAIYLSFLSFPNLSSARRMKSPFRRRDENRLPAIRPCKGRRQQQSLKSGRCATQGEPRGFRPSCAP